MRLVTSWSLLVSSLSAQAVWTQLYPAVSPSPRNNPSMACFEPTGDVVMLFGDEPNGLSTQSWSLQGSTWIAFQSPPQPGYARGLVYDSVRQRLVVFGGHAPLSVNDDTWEWNGSQWTNPGPATRPSPRAQFAMAFDRSRGVTVVFGGVAANNGYLADLWEWDGTNWLQRAAATPLGARAYSLAAFDPIHGNVLVHGGLSQLPNGATIHNDTWAWNGTSWSQYQPPMPPPYDVQGAMVTDLHRGRVILYGGGAGTLTREWDGANWTIIGPPLPGSRIGHGMAYDTAGRRTVVFGGTALGNFVQDTWIYRTALPADVAPFGAGCPGTAGTPALANTPYVYPWLGDTMTNVAAPCAANALGALFVSSFGTMSPLSLNALGLPGCELLVPLDLVELRPAAAGEVEWSLAIPSVPALAAATFRQQAFVLDPAANPFGLAASNAVTVTLGVR